MSAKHAVLGLVIERPGYGYQLAQRLDERFGSSGFAPSGVYSALDQLSRDDLVRSAGEMGAGPARRAAPRTIYEATEEGVDHFEAWMLDSVAGAAAARRAAHEDRAVPAAQPAAADRDGRRPGTGRAWGACRISSGSPRRASESSREWSAADADAREPKPRWPSGTRGSNGCRTRASCSSSCATSRASATSPGSLADGGARIGRRLRGL